MDFLQITSILQPRFVLGYSFCDKLIARERILVCNANKRKITKELKLIKVPFSSRCRDLIWNLCIILYGFLLFPYLKRILSTILYHQHSAERLQPKIDQSNSAKWVHQYNNLILVCSYVYKQYILGYIY